MNGPDVVEIPREDAIDLAVEGHDLLISIIGEHGKPIGFHEIAKRYKQRWTKEKQDRYPGYPMVSERRWALSYLRELVVYYGYVNDVKATEAIEGREIGVIKHELSQKGREYYVSPDKARLGSEISRRYSS